jgi:hypothetical protein
MKNNITILFALILCLSTKQQLSSQISIHPSGHYFVYQGEPVIMITSDHTYAAVIKPGFDYHTFLNTLANAGMNFTRIYPGAYPGTGWSDEPLILPWVQNEDGLDFISMRHYSDFSGVNHEAIPGKANAWATAMAEPGQQYAMYINYSCIPSSVSPGFYKAIPGNYKEKIILEGVPAGNYSIEWVNPSDGNLIGKSFQRKHPGGNLELNTTVFSVDIALKILRN